MMALNKHDQFCRFLVNKLVFLLEQYFQVRFGVHLPNVLPQT